MSVSIYEPLAHWFFFEVFTRSSESTSMLYSSLNRLLGSVQFEHCSLHSNPMMLKMRVSTDWLKQHLSWWSGITVGQSQNQDCHITWWASPPNDYCKTPLVQSSPFVWELHLEWGQKLYVIGKTKHTQMSLEEFLSECRGLKTVLSSQMRSHDRN